MPMSAAKLTTDGAQQQNHRGSVVSNTQDMWTEVMWVLQSTHDHGLWAEETPHRWLCADFDMHKTGRL